MPEGFIKANTDNNPGSEAYIELLPISVNVGGTGANNIALAKQNLALNNVDNTSDVNKPISTATQTALNGKFNSPAGTISQYIRGDGSLASFPSVPVLPIAQSSVTNLVSDLAGKASITHTHSAADITSGTKTSTFISDFVEAAQDAAGAALSSEFVYNDGSNSIALRSRSFSPALRTLNAAFQISATRDVLASYSVDISTSVSLAGGQVGTVFLEYADDNTFTTNVVEVGRFVNGNTGTLVVGLTLNQTNTAPVSGLIPAGKYVRLRTQNNTGTPVFTYRSGQEVLF